MFLKSWHAVLLPVVFFISVSLCLSQTVEQAQQLQARGDWKGAEQTWRALLERAPQDYRLWSSLGIALSHQERYMEAIAAYRKALAI